MIGLWEIITWGGGSVAFSLAGLYLTKKLFAQIDVRSNVDFLLAVVTIVGTLVSVVLGLLVSSSVEQYRTSEEKVNREATCILDVFRMSRGLPEKNGSIIQSLCIDYCDAAVKYEWPAMRRGEISDDLTQVAAKLNDSLVSFHPADIGQSNIHQAMLSSLAEVVHSRRARVDALKSNWSRNMLPIILMCSIIILALSYIYADKQPSKVQILLVSFVAIALGSNMGLLLELSRPFSGRNGISCDQFVLDAKLLRNYINTPLLIKQ